MLPILFALLPFLHLQHGVQSFPFDYKLGINSDWSVHFVLTRRLKRVNNTTDSSVLAENKVISNTKTIQRVVSHQSKPIIYTSTRQALLANSLFINHTNDPKVYIPPFVDHSWREIQYFPWEMIPSLSFQVVSMEV